MHDFGSPPDGWLHCILKPLRRQVHAKSLLAFQDEAALHIVESGAQLHLQRGRAHRAAHLEPRGRLHGSCSAGARCKRMRRSQWRLVEYPAWRHAGDAIPAGGASILRVVSGKGDASKEAWRHAEAMRAHVCNLPLGSRHARGSRGIKVSRLRAQFLHFVGAVLGGWTTYSSGHL